MMAALGCGFLPCRQALGPVKRPQQERPGAFKVQAPEMIEDRLPRWEIGR